LFSTITFWPSDAVMSCAMTRPITSVGPPAAKPMSSLMGLAG
jgi:hypothetical protein